MIRFSVKKLAKSKIIGTFWRLKLFLFNFNVLLNTQNSLNKIDGEYIDDMITDDFKNTADDTKMFKTCCQAITDNNNQNPDINIWMQKKKEMKFNIETISVNKNMRIGGKEQNKVTERLMKIK